MERISVELSELKAAIAEIESRSNDVRVTIEVQDRKVKISASDRGSNIMEAILFEDGTMGAQFRCTERLMFMKDKKRL